jgi:hypothetical protein
MSPIWKPKNTTIWLFALMASSLNKGDLFFYIFNVEGLILHKLTTFCNIKKPFTLDKKNIQKGLNLY